MFFAASADGSIRQVNLFRQREDKFSRAAMEAVGGAGVSDVIRIDDLDSDASRKAAPLYVPRIWSTSSLTDLFAIQVFDLGAQWNEEAL